MTAEAPPMSRLNPGVRESGSDTPARSRFGIKAKLFLAVCALAGLTAVASAVAWYVFADIGRSVGRMTTESLPGMVSALRLAQKSSEIAITAPALMASRSQEERVREQVQLAQRTEELTALIEDLRVTQAGPAATGRLLELRDGLTLTLEQLNTAIERRLDLNAERRARLAELAEIHARFLNRIEPLVDDAVFDLVISGERVTAESTRAITGLVEDGVGRLDRLLSINAEANLVA
jgi:phosphoglycerate-specific signal transduction histidine kinase